MYKTIMNLLIIIVLAVLLFSACSVLDKPVPSQAAKVKALSSHVASINSYEIPKGIFRGVLWPNKTTKDFQVWIIDGSKEVFFKITAPPELGVETKDVTKDWTIKKIDNAKDKMAYSAVRNDGSKSLQFELPVKKRDYSFTVLNTASGEEVLLFMDIAENIVDKGFFGYIIIKKQS